MNRKANPRRGSLPTGQFGASQHATLKSQASLDTARLRLHSLDDDHRRRQDDVPPGMRDFLKGISCSAPISRRDSGKKNGRIKSKSTKPISQRSLSTSSDSPSTPTVIVTTDDHQSPFLSPDEHFPEFLTPGSRRQSLPPSPTEKSALTNREYDKIKEKTRFTEYEIVTLWTQFKDNFPSGRINRVQLGQLIKQVFPVCGDVDLVVDNLMRLFDVDGTGSIAFVELMMTFSMSMKGTVREKLHWSFKLYDRDGNNEIDEEEMIDIFGKMCYITRMADEAAREETAEPLKTDAKADRRKGKPKSELELIKESLPMLSSKMKAETKKPKKRSGWKQSASTIVSQETELVDVNPDPPDPPKLNTDVVIQLLKDETRDCTKFDPVERAKELFKVLDADGSGAISEEEFVEGCLSDTAFVDILENFNDDMIWK